MIASDRYPDPAPTEPADAPPALDAAAPAADARALVTVEALPARNASWMLRRIRHVVRRRLRVELASLGVDPALVSDGELRVVLTPVSVGDPRTVAWRADRAVELVVIRDGCGARVLGRGGLEGRIELPTTTCAEAYIAFCYDLERAPAPESWAGTTVTRP